MTILATTDLQAHRRLPVDELPEYQSRPELAAYTGVAVQTLARWATEGTGPKITHLGRHVRYKRADVQAWLDNAERTSAAEAS